MTEQDDIKTSGSANREQPLQVAIQREVIHISGYSPEVLEKFESIIDGSARELFDNMLEESRCRRAIERDALDANILVRSRKLDESRKKTSGIIISNIIGQFLGFIVCMTCIGAAVYLGIVSPEYWKVPVAITAIPTATVIWALRGRWQKDKNHKNNGNETNNETP